MVPHHNAQYLAGLVSELRQLPRETEWVEFKVNRADPQDIGEYISALANGAALNGKERRPYPLGHCGRHPRRYRHRL